MDPNSVPQDQLDPLSRLQETLRTQYHSWIYLDAAAIPSSLLGALSENLPHIPQCEWPSRFDFGGVYVNGHLALSDAPLSAPCKVEYYEPKFEIARAHEIYPNFEPQFILHRDDDIAVIYKPDKLPSMPAKEQRYFSVKRSVELLTGCKVHMPSRLDVSTEGLLVLSLSTRAHGPLQRAFEERAVEKRYAFATHSIPSWREHTETGNIGRDALHPVLRRVVTGGGLKANTHFSIARLPSEHTPDITIIEAQPTTGRTHQIRVHAAHLNVPIVGDNFYGGRPASRLHLLSRQVSFKHPLSGTALSFSLPESFLPTWAKNIIWRA